MMEAMLPEYGALGKIKQPTGGAIATAAPSNAYPTSDDDWVLIAANSEPLFAKLANLMEQREMATNPRFIDNPSRVAHAAELDAMIGTWAKQYTAVALVKLLEDAGIPCSKVYTAADCAADPQYRQRGMVRNVKDPLFGSVLHPGIVPHVPESPGSIRWTGAPIGHHTDEVLTSLLGMSPDEIASLKASGAVG
jgi:crotonobetainyl-CoA:carnitine CoA-transferase CaiB-like acyl-CoA transferase